MKRDKSLNVCLFQKINVSRLFGGFFCFLTYLIDRRGVFTSKWPLNQFWEITRYVCSQNLDVLLGWVYITNFYVQYWAFSSLSNDTSIPGMCHLLYANQQHFEEWNFYAKKCINLWQKLPRDNTAEINIFLVFWLAKSFDCTWYFIVKITYLVSFSFGVVYLLHDMEYLVFGMMNL